MKALPVGPGGEHLVFSASCFFPDADPAESKAESDGELKDRKCTICSQIFTTESQLQKHHREHETNDKVLINVNLIPMGTWKSYFVTKFLKASGRLVQ